MSFPNHVPTFSAHSRMIGSVAGIVGEDYAMLASDTRLSAYQTIHSRSQSKLFNLTEHSVLGTCGSWNDCLTLSRVVQMHVIKYEIEHRKTISTSATAHMMSILMYNKRLFPFYQQSMLAGLDQCGKGCLYSFDPLGHMIQCTYMAVGTGCTLLVPFLDSQLKMRTDKNLLSQVEALGIIRDGFDSITERDIYTGDSIHVKIITSGGISEEYYELKKD